MGFTGNITGYLTGNMIVGFVCGLKMEYAFKIAAVVNGKTDHQLYRFGGSLFSIPHVMTIDTVTTLVTLGLQGQNQNNMKSVGIIYRFSTVSH